MMSSKPTSRFMDPVAHAKLPRLETTLGTKSGDMPGYPHEEPLNYSGTYFSYCLGGPEQTDLPAHWSPPGACLQRSPIVHPTGVGRPLTNQITHRPENMAHCVEGSPHLATRDLAANQQQSYYDRVPEKQGPSVPGIHAPTAVRKLAVGGASVSAPRGSPVGLAVPKPIYGHNPCCTEHGCTSGPCYSMEHGAPRVHPSAYNEEWMLHYGPLSLLQRKEREALLQLEQSSVRFPLREAAPEGYHAMRPTRPMRVPPFIEPNYGNFPYTSTARSPLSPSSDLYHRLQFPSKVYHSLPPPPTCTYEDVQQMALTHPGISPKIYPDRPPPAPRYMQLPQRPMFYYTQGNMDLENPSLYKGTSRNLTADPPPTVSKQVSPNPLGPCLRPQASLSDFSAPCPAAPMNSSFPRNCDLSHFQLYRAHAGMAGQKRAFAEGPGAPLQVRHADRPVDYSSQGAWVTSSPTELCKRPLSPGAFHPVQQSLTDYRSSDHMSVGKGQILGNHRLEDEQSGPKVAAHHEGGAVAGARPALHCSSVEHTSSVYAEVTTSKNHRENASSPHESLDVGQTDRSKDVYDVQAASRLQEEKESEQRRGGWLHSSPSPPMPVINKVFSLAPYKAYLQASGMLPLQNGLQNTKACCNERNSQQGMDEPTHKASVTVRSQPSPEANPVHMLEPHQIKSEKVTLGETDCSLKSDEIGCEGEHQGLKESMVKEEETDKVTSSSDSVLDLRVKKGEFNEIQTSMELLSSTAYGVDAADRHGVMRGLNRNGEHSVLVAPPLKPVTPTAVPLETKVFQQIPPQCLNLSAFKIVVPDVLRHPAPSHAPEIPQPAPEPKSPGEANRQARHRFMEMHQSLFRLISASVSRAPEQELRAWLTNLEPQVATSSAAKAPPVTGLLGAMAKQAWLRCGDTAAALSLVVGRLEDYAANQQCPFPHVIRAGTLFIPMLVVKEYLFPQVLGALIDRVLQEHHVELRPTTLSEERHLMQLQRRACSSKLRRLLSLKHLPDIYPDVLNLYYHACVSKRLDSTSPAGAQKTAQVCSAPH
ncbi:hypothetical protein SKAU_G00318060 [Synaphobranchus kaupii]|uniref:Uncharacterized protein n=1 Tax=Synaphobranchus kaupii TaxID=118154 RepID=A0A9Q1ET32_SYNKA|nr:hypothetical protein SKAU_G00318060 [Synaphobranchus kaupii]